MKLLSHKFFWCIFITFYVSYAAAVSLDNGIPAACQTNCSQPYGEVLGVSSPDVKAYSNCQPACVNFEPTMVNDIYTGIRWQCVEFARRWLLVHKGAVYGDVETAADIWDKIDHLTHVESNKIIPLESHLNGSTQPPLIGDLLIYTKEFNNTGHVAVVTNVDYDKGLIEVGEQNYKNEKWPGNYARSIEFMKKDKRFWLLDGYLLGWKKIIN